MTREDKSEGDEALRPVSEAAPQRVRLSRRTLLLSGGALLASTGLLGAFVQFGGWERLRRSVIRRKLEKHFHYLSLVPEGVDRFIDEFETHQYAIRRNPLKLFSEIPDAVYLSFLASSTYFYNGEDESKPIDFVSLWAPKVGLCINPFSLRLLPAGTENEPWEQ